MLVNYTTASETSCLTNHLGTFAQTSFLQKIIENEEQSDESADISVQVLLVLALTLWLLLFFLARYSFLALLK